MPQGKGTYGDKIGRPAKKNKKIQTQKEINKDWKKFNIELENLNKIELDRIKTENKTKLLQSEVIEAEHNNEHGKVAEIVTKLYGTPEEQKQIKKINDKQEKNNDISKEDFAKRTKISSKYHDRLINNPLGLTEKEMDKVDKYKKELTGGIEHQKIMSINQSPIKSDGEFNKLVLYKVLDERKPETQAKKSESKQEFNKIDHSFDLMRKPTQLARPGYAGGGKNKRR